MKQFLVLIIHHKSRRTKNEKLKNVSDLWQSPKRKQKKRKQKKKENKKGKKTKTKKKKNQHNHQHIHHN